MCMSHRGGGNDDDVDNLLRLEALMTLLMLVLLFYNKYINYFFVSNSSLIKFQNPH